MERLALESALEDFGLKKKEIDVYLAVLKMGSSRVTRIAAQANIIRETTYAVLEVLIKKGLARYVIRSGVKYYEASSPQKFLNILKEKEDKIHSILPSLLALEMSTTKKPSVELYEGVQGIKTIIDDFIKTKKPMLCVGSTESLLEKLSFYFPQYIARRIQENISIKVLTVKTSRTQKMRLDDEKVLREMRFIPDKYSFPNAIFIYGDKLALLDLEKNLVGIIIENEELKKSFTSIFNLLWDSSSI